MIGVLLTLLLCCSSVLAQNEILAQADSLFQAGDYERVELLVLRAERQAELSDSLQLQMELLGGYSLIMLGRESEARLHFSQALDLDSSLMLDPVEVSPKFRVVFDDVKREWSLNREKVLQLADSSTNVPSFKVDPSADGKTNRIHTASPAATRLNILLPGAGFLREGKTTRGLIHAGVTLVLAGLWLSELSQNNSARDDYLAAGSSPEAETLYDEYDSHHRRMWAFGLTSLGAYALSQVDLALFSERVRIAAIPTSTGVSLAARF